MEAFSHQVMLTIRPRLGRFAGRDGRVPAPIVQRCNSSSERVRDLIGVTRQLGASSGMRNQVLTSQYTTLQFRVWSPNRV